MKSKNDDLSDNQWLLKALFCGFFSNRVLDFNYHGRKKNSNLRYASWRTMCSRHAMMYQSTRDISPSGRSSSWYIGNQAFVKAWSLKIHHETTTGRIYRDNVNTDIFGANLYDKYLRKVSSGKNRPARQSILQVARRGVHHFIEDEEGPRNIPFTAERCFSILVEVRTTM
jgi:hypothetical protein